MTLSMGPELNGTVKGARRRYLTVPKDPDGLERLRDADETVQLAAGIVMQQKQLREALGRLTPKQTLFLRVRATTPTDAEARHIAGHRREGQEEKFCGCPMNVQGWTDLREDTVAKWKRVNNGDNDFMVCYSALLTAPVVYAATRIELLAAMASGVYGELLLDPEVSPGVKRLAAKDVMTMNGLFGSDGGGDPVNAVQQSMNFKLAMARFERGLEITEQQKQLLRQGGVNPDVPRAPVVRSLDGEDVVEGQFYEPPEPPEPPESLEAELPELPQLPEPQREAEGSRSYDWPVTPVAPDSGVAGPVPSAGQNGQGGLSPEVLAALPVHLRGGR